MESNEQLETRKLEEIEFANKRYAIEDSLNADDLQKVYANNQFYSIARAAGDYIERLLSHSAEKEEGKKILDYCCGRGENIRYTVKKYGLDLTGIDISDESVRIANRKAKEEGIDEHCRYFVMDAEHTTFEDNTFDIIYCSGCLHHLELEAAYKELSRILKPDGKIIAMEALAHNPVIHAYRKLTPKIRTSWEVDHILSYGRIKLSKRYFSGLDTKMFYLFSLVAVPFRKTFLFKPVLTVMEWVDAVVLRISGIRWWAWQCVFVLTKPKK